MRYVWVLSLFLVSCGSPEPEPMDPFKQDSRRNTQTIIFGNDEEYTLGDGQAVGSSCQDRLNGTELSGTRYEFDFTITGSETTVTASLEDVCGVDYVSNVMALQKQGQTLRSTFLSSSSAVSLDSILLQPGTYTIVVEAGGQIDGLSAYDLDDFIIGRLRIQATKSLTQGAVRVERRANRTNKISFGAGHDFHLGDSVGEGLTCSPSQTVVRAATTMEYRFRVPTSGALVHIVSGAVCGVSYNQNDFFLLDAAGQTLDYSVLDTMFDGAFPSMTLPAGDYRVQVRVNPELQGADVDDILIQQIDIWSDVALQNLGAFALD